MAQFVEIHGQEILGLGEPAAQVQDYQRQYDQDDDPNRRPRHPGTDTTAGSLKTASGGKPYTSSAGPGQKVIRFMAMPTAFGLCVFNQRAVGPAIPIGRRIDRTES
jgi:hypothetical protein